MLEVNAIEDLAQISARCGEADPAARLLGCTNAIHARRAWPREFTEQIGYDRTMSILHESPSERRLASLMSEGAAMDETTAVAEAMATPFTAD